MIVGMSISTFTTVHVILSLIGVAAGFVVVLGMIRGKHSGALVAIFLTATVLTSVTGFPIPPFGFDPPRAVSVLSLLLLVLAIAALYVFRLAGWWRWIYVVTSAATLYFNCFVGVVRTFQKISFFNSLAPTQSEPPFAIAQGAMLIIFALGVLGVRKLSQVRRGGF